MDTELYDSYICVLVNLDTGACTCYGEWEIEDIVSNEQLYAQAAEAMAQLVVNMSCAHVVGHIKLVRA